MLICFFGLSMFTAILAYVGYTFILCRKPINEFTKDIVDWAVLGGMMVVVSTSFLGLLFFNMAQKFLFY